MTNNKKNLFRIEGFFAVGLAAYKLVFVVLHPPKPAPTLFVSVFIIFGIYIIAATKGWSERLLAVVLVTDITSNAFLLRDFSPHVARLASLLFAAIYVAVALFCWTKGRKAQHQGQKGSA